MIVPGERVVIVDADNMVHRLYHAVPEHRAPNGQQLNAVIGWARSLRRFRRKSSRRLDWLLPIFDGDGPGWRSEIHPGYKSDRSPDDDDLVSQWPLVREMTEALQLPLIRVPGVEADDLIAAYTEAAILRGCEVLVVSNDKDLAQLVRGDVVGPGSVRVLAGKDVRGPAEVRDRYGVGPELLGDLLALAGDKTDSIPGVPGFGMKTALRVLAERGTLELALDEWSLVPGKTGEKLRDHAADARMSRILVGLRADTPMPIAFDDLRRWVPSSRALDEFFARFGYPRFGSAMDPHQE